MISADKALRIILKSAKPLPGEKVKLRRAVNRTLAEDVVARENIPPFDNSSMDGFAVRSFDLTGASKKNPVTHRILGESSAGSVFKKKVGKGEAVRIMTGGKIPPGADCVVPIELVRVVDAGQVQFTALSTQGRNIRRAGEDIKRKDTVLRKGHMLTPARIGLLASLGLRKVRVVRKPKVNILATGDELVRLGRKLREGQIRNSTSYALAGFVEQCEGVPRLLGVVRDKKKRIRKAILKGIDCDILLITGGVSVGKYDLVKDILKEIGVSILFWQVNIKPGKPLLFGKINRTLIFGLPGNPASTSVTFLQFVRPAIDSMLRLSKEGLRLSAVLDQSIRKSDGKKHFVRGVATTVNGVLRVRATGSQSSGVMSSVAKANCLIILPERTTIFRKGSKVEIELLG